ncbi:MAG: hypothetical protein EBX76_00820 [Acidimicrobiia bacterium]|nr:hypothetical protein [Acidimicrobiia bacterium]
MMKHLRSIPELGADGLTRLLELTNHMVEVNRRPVPKVPALRGRTVVSLFFEDSTRTRLSFETAAKRLSADTMTFSVSTSSVNKGESLRDTVETITMLPSDAVVMHPGPMNRGVEMLIDPSALPNSLIHRQVANGVSVRMAVLFDLLAGESSAGNLREVAP